MTGVDLSLLMTTGEERRGIEDVAAGHGANALGGTINPTSNRLNRGSIMIHGQGV